MIVQYITAKHCSQQVGSVLDRLNINTLSTSVPTSYTKLDAAVGWIT